MSTSGTESMRIANATAESAVVPPLSANEPPVLPLNAIESMESDPFTVWICARRRRNHVSVEVCSERLSTRIAIVSP